MPVPDLEALKVHPSYCFLVWGQVTSIEFVSQRSWASHIRASQARQPWTDWTRLGPELEPLTMVVKFTCEMIFYKSWRFFASFWFLHFIDSFWPKKCNCPKNFKPKYKTVRIFPSNLLNLKIVFTDEIQNHTVYLLITWRTIVGVGIFGRTLLRKVWSPMVFLWLIQWKK